MAAVWRARDRSDADAVVAVKLLREDFLKRNPKEAANNIRRFKRESEILKLGVDGLETGHLAPGDARPDERMKDVLALQRLAR